MPPATAALASSAAAVPAKRCSPRRLTVTWLAQAVIAASLGPSRLDRFVSCRTVGFGLSSCGSRRAVLESCRERCSQSRFANWDRREYPPGGLLDHFDARSPVDHHLLGA